MVELKLAIIAAGFLFFVFRSVRGKASATSSEQLAGIEKRIQEARTEAECQVLVTELDAFAAKNTKESLQHRIRLAGSRVCVRKAHLEIARLTNTTYEPDQY